MDSDTAWTCNPLLCGSIGWCTGIHHVWSVDICMNTGVPCAPVKNVLRLRGPPAVVRPVRPRGVGGGEFCAPRPVRGES